MKQTWKVSAEEVKLGGMPPDTPRLRVPLLRQLALDASRGGASPQKIRETRA